MASAFTWQWAPADLASGRRRTWTPADDVWQVGQLTALLVDPRMSSPLESRDVRYLDCSDQLKFIIGRAVGPRRYRYDDAEEMAAALRGDAVPDASPEVGTLHGRHVVFTGRLSIPRTDVKRLVVETGGSVGESVSPSTDVLVCGAATATYVAGCKGSKVMAAESLNEDGHGIRMIDAATFSSLVRARQLDRTREKAARPPLRPVAHRQGGHNSLS